MGDIRIKDLTTAASLTGEEFLAVDDGSADGTTQKTGLNNVSAFIQQKYGINQKIPFLTPSNISVGTSINNLSTSILLTSTDYLTDIPENMVSSIGSWCLVFTFIFANGTGTQFMTSLFSTTAENLKIFKRHLASGVWSGFAAIN